jgi:hypothetical protein
MPFLTPRGSEGPPTWAVESTGRPGWYRLTRPLVYEGKRERFVVAAGFETDYASVPRLFTWLFARDAVYTPAAILHDYLCVEAYAGLFSRRDADGVFRRVLREAGVDPVTRYALWAAVRVGGMAWGYWVSGRIIDPPVGREWPQLAGLGLVLVPLLAVPALLVTVVWALWTAVGWLAAWIERHR